MPRIRLLSPEVSSRIAAGEVIERPASLLKELLENSLDAGATRIVVEAKGAGKASLRVSDDGCGMDPADCELALKRHATSKIGALEDLERLRTFGFRGEALFAIAAVSRFSLTSRAKGASAGWRIEAEGGEIRSSGPAAAAVGTVVEVRDLFHNTPARLKFLKSDALEKSRLTAVVEEAALANPSVHFTYKSEGRTVLHFAPEAAGPQAQARRVASVLGTELAAPLLPLAAERPELGLRLYVSPADQLAATRSLQYWFVNRRPVETRLLQQALYRAYAELRTKDRHPACVGFLELDPGAFDVNVHPGKREVRFKGEKDIFDLVSGIIAAGLAKARVPAPLVPEGRPAAAVAEPVPAYYLGGRSYFPEEPVFALKSEPASALAPEAGAPRWFTPPYRFLGQVESSYLVFEASGGLFILDQHAAAERILFERFLKEVDEGAGRSQRLMLPLPIELPASAVQKVLAQKERLARLGFTAEPFGKTTLQFTSVPAVFHKAADLKELLHRLLDAVTDPSGAARDVRHDAVATIACKAAVKAHDRLSEKEALRLLEDLKDCADGSCCPHGRRAMLAMGRDELARRFQRPGAPPL